MKLLICLPLFLLLCGCEVLPYPRELESTVLVRVLGVDLTGEGVLLTAADVSEEGREAKVFFGQGTDFEGGIRALKESGEESVALTHVTQILVGEESELRPVLEAVLLNREVGQSATVWQTAGPARELMEAVQGGARRLTSVELNVEGLPKTTVLETLAQLEESGGAELPLLRVAEGVLEVVF